MRGKQKLEIAKSFVEEVKNLGVDHVYIDIAIYNQEKVTLEEQRNFSEINYIDVWDDMRKRLVLNGLKINLLDVEVNFTRVKVGDKTNLILILDNEKRHIEIEVLKEC